MFGFIKNWFKNRSHEWAVESARLDSLNAEREQREADDKLDELIWLRADGFNALGFGFDLEGQISIAKSQADRARKESLETQACYLLVKHGLK